MEHMKNVARGLENKIIELQQKLTEKVMVHDCSQYLVTEDQIIMFCGVWHCIQGRICYRKSIHLSIVVPAILTKP